MDGRRVDDLARGRRRPRGPGGPRPRPPHRSAPTDGAPPPVASDRGRTKGAHGTKRRLIAVAVAGLLLTSGGGSALADRGGVPNANACLGETVSTESRAGAPPPAGAEQLGLDNAGELLRAVRRGEAGSTEVAACRPRAPR